MTSRPTEPTNPRQRRRRNAAGQGPDEDSGPVAVGDMCAGEVPADRACYCRVGSLGHIWNPTFGWCPTPRVAARIARNGVAVRADEPGVFPADDSIGCCHEPGGRGLDWRGCHRCFVETAHTRIARNGADR